MGNPVILISSDGEAHAGMSRPLVVLVLGVIALMVVSWALGRILFWLRATFPPNRPPRRRR
jgi:hypothetical protein